MLIQPLSAPKELKAGWARGPVNKMSFQRSNLMGLAFVCGQALWCGKTTTAKALVAFVLIILVKRKVSECCTGVQRFDDLPMEPMHLLHHLLLLLKSTKSTLNPFLPLRCATLPIVEKSSQIVRIDRRRGLWFQLAHPLQVSKEASNPGCLTKRLLPMEQVLQIGWAVLPKPLSVKQSISSQEHSSCRC